MTHGGLEEEFGGDLLSRTVARAVPSALESLTSVFGMGTGGTSPLWPPKKQDTGHRRQETDQNGAYAP